MHQNKNLETILFWIMIDYIIQIHRNQYQLVFLEMNVHYRDTVYTIAYLF